MHRNQTFLNRTLAEEVHSLEIVLERADDDDRRGLSRRDLTGFVVRPAGARPGQRK